MVHDNYTIIMINYASDLAVVVKINAGLHLYDRATVYACSIVCGNMHCPLTC